MELGTETEKPQVEIREVDGVYMRIETRHDGEDYFFGVNGNENGRHYDVAHVGREGKEQWVLELSGKVFDSVERGDATRNKVETVLDISFEQAQKLSNGTVRVKFTPEPQILNWMALNTQRISSQRERYNHH